MKLSTNVLPSKSYLTALLDYFGRINDLRQQWKVRRNLLPEVLLLVVCGTICDCDD